MKKIKCEWFDDMVYMLRYYDNDFVGLKRELITRSKHMVRNKVDREQMINFLYDTWCDMSGNNGMVKNFIHQIVKQHRSYTLPLEVYRCMLALTFPSVRVIIKCISNRAENNSFFTPHELIAEVLSDYSKDVNRYDDITLMLNTMLEVGIVKKLSKNLYKTQQWPVFEELCLKAVLLTASTVSGEVLGEKNDFLKLLSFEIDHNFSDRHKEINYEKLVGETLWQSFLNSGTEYTLQYRDGRFKLSDKEFIYGGINLSRTAILAMR